MVRPHVDARAKAAQKRVKQACPECGKDMHDPDCAYYVKKGR